MSQMFSSNTFGLLIFFISLYFSDSFLQNSESLFKNIGVQKIVYPKVLTRKETITRLKRSTNSDEHVGRESLYIALNRWTIKTNFNDDLVISPNYVSQWIHSARDSKPLFDYNNQKLHKCLQLKGSVEEVENSSVLLTLCNNDIFGLINISRKSFFIQPTDINKRHILYETTIPFKLATKMKKFWPDSSNWSEDQYDKDLVMNNIINNDEKTNSEEEERCMALVIGNNGTKYIEVESSLCSENYRKNNNEENGEIQTSRERVRRESGQFDYTYDYYNTERPYRVTIDCFERQRTKRALSICDTAEYYNMTLDLATSDYIDYVDTENESKLGDVYDDEVVATSHDYHSPQNIDEQQSAYVSSRRLPIYRPPPRITYRWAKMVIGVDYDVIKFHGRRTEHYVFTILNIVSSLFKEISSTIIFRIVIMKMYLYPDRKDSVIHSGDMKYPLYNVNKWNREVWKKAIEKYDMAIWYTHFQMNEEIRTSPGPFMCQWQWSCLLIEDVGWLSAARIAHGIGHLLGLTHDGDLSANNNCASAALLETPIMAPIIPAIMPNPVWSSCSKSEYELLVRKYPCLERPPTSYEHTEFFYGVFSLDEQCRIEFGDGWVFCSRISVRDPCKELWCNKNVGNRRSCMTRQTRTLEGTLCGRGQRCINQTCEDATRPGYMQDHPGITTLKPQLPRPPVTTTIKPPGLPKPPVTATIKPPGLPKPPVTATIKPPVLPSPPVATTIKPPGLPTPPVVTTIKPPVLPSPPVATTIKPPGLPTPPGVTTIKPPVLPSPPVATTIKPPVLPSPPVATTIKPPVLPSPPVTTPIKPPVPPSPPGTAKPSRQSPSHPGATTNSLLGQQNMRKYHHYRHPGYIRARVFRPKPSRYRGAYSRNFQY